MSIWIPPKGEYTQFNSAKDCVDWRDDVSAMLMMMDPYVWRIVKGTIKLEDLTTEEEREKFRDANGKAVGFIILTLGRDMKHYAKSRTNAHELWRALERIFDHRGVARESWLAA